MKIKITAKPYNYTCGDNCCYEYGTVWKVNGEEVYSGPDEDEAFLAILKYANIKATISALDEETGEEVTSLANYVEDPLT